MDQGTLPEGDLLPLAEQLPNHYDHRYKKRIQKVRFRLQLIEVFQQELAKVPPSDVMLAKIWQKMQLEGLSWSNHQEVQRCDLAVQRRKCLSLLKKIDPNLPADEQDRLWLDRWNATLLDKCPDAKPFRNRLELAQKRLQAWQTLEAALEAQNLSRIKKLAGNPLLKNYPPLVAQGDVIAECMALAEGLENLLQLLNQGRAEVFALNADFSFIRQNANLLAPYQQQIEEMLGDWLATTGSLGKSDPPYQVNHREGTTLARWVWKHVDRISFCQLAVHPTRFFNKPEDAQDDLFTVNPEDHRRSRGGFPIFGDSRRASVTVWATIDLDWIKVTGPPLRLGPIPLTPLV